MFRRCLTAVLLVSLCGPPPLAQVDVAAQREAMVRAVAQMARDAGHYTGLPELDPRVMEAIGRVPRHEFVPAGVRDDAYENRPLPIGEGQTISQPYIVALMTDLADVGPDSVVLEIGTGSGYQAAVLAELAGRVYTIEILAPLGERAAQTLARLGYDDVNVRIGDGYRGWPEFAPFDAILVTAAPDTVPQPLIEQLAVGGRLVVPVGPAWQSQSLQVLVKRADGELERRQVLPVRFVPFLREREEN